MYQKLEIGGTTDSENKLEILIESDGSIVIYVTDNENPYDYEHVEITKDSAKVLVAFLTSIL